MVILNFLILLKLKSKMLESVLPLNFSKFSRISKQVDSDTNFLKNNPFLTFRSEEIFTFLLSVCSSVLVSLIKELLYGIVLPGAS